MKKESMHLERRQWWISMRFLIQINPLKTFLVKNKTICHLFSTWGHIKMISKEILYIADDL